jgi:hypothetical protein
MIVKALNCQNCGAPLGEKSVCDYCHTRFVVESEFGMKPVRDVIGDGIFYHGLLTMLGIGPSPGLEYCGTGRLTSFNLSIGIGMFSTRLYKSCGMIHNTFHLIVPPILYAQTMVLLCSKLFPGTTVNDTNVLPLFIECVWIDGAIEYQRPNIPWILSSVQPNEIASLDDMYFSFGYTP